MVGCCLVMVRENVFEYFSLYSWTVFLVQNENKIRNTYSVASIFHTHTAKHKLAYHLPVSFFFFKSFKNYFLKTQHSALKSKWALLLNATL